MRGIAEVAVRLVQDGILVNRMLHGIRESNSRAMLGTAGKMSVLSPYLCQKRCATSG
jgi:hypothetical protein